MLKTALIAAAVMVASWAALAMLATVVVGLVLRYAARQVPRAVLLEAWPGEPRMLTGLLGSAAR